MKRSWYQTSKLCTALRKHVLRVDLCVFIDEEKVFSDENYLNSTIKSILTAAIIKGLDIKQWQVSNIIKLRTAGMEDVNI